MFYLTLRPIATPHDDPSEYIVDLLNGDYAVIVSATGGWSMTVHAKDDHPMDRGLFGTPDDALAVLTSEVSERITACVHGGGSILPLGQQAILRHAR